MGKKTKLQSPDEILARAEKMFLRGNYLLARREFENAAAIAECGDLTTKIEVCNRKIEEEKAEDLVKKARKFAGKGDNRAALRCFEEAFAITGEDWIGESISRLQEVTLSQDLSMAAQEAEAAGEYLKAAELYSKTPGYENRNDLRLKRAGCLVRAERYHEATLLFQEGDEAGPDVLYNWGFALAMTGNYYQCLKVWEKIPSKDQRFQAQKQTVRELLLYDLLSGYERGDQPGAIYQQGRYLLDAGEKEEALTNVVRSCGYAWLGELWNDEQFDRIMEVLDSWPFQMEPTLLQVYARCSFKVAEESGTRLNDLAMYWLPAVYAAQAAGGRAALKDGVALREELIRRAEDLLKRPQGVKRDFAETDFECWNVDRGLLEDVCELADGRKKDLHFFICTPRLAARYGISDTIVALIRNKRKHFSDLERYLKTGAFYSSAGEALYLLEKGDYNRALQSLPEGDNLDRFTLWGIHRVIFACGIHSMKQGENPPRGFPDAAVKLLDQVPRFESELIDGAGKAEKLEILSRYEESLTAIHALQSRKRLDQALSYVMSRRALKMYNKDLMNDKVMALTLKKALDLDPENEHALGLLADTRVDLECMELDKALNGHKMNRACKIAEETEHEKVRELFFEFMQGLIDGLDNVDYDRPEKIIFLNTVHGWCARVDDEHDILYDIQEMIEEVEEGEGK